MTTIMRTALAGLGLAAALVLAGCASTHGIHPEAQLREPVVPGASAQVAPVVADWWREFRDPQLDARNDAAVAVFLRRERRLVREGRGGRPAGLRHGEAS